MRLPRTAGAIFDRIVNLLVISSGIVFVFMMLSVSFDVTRRYFFGRGILWLPEVLEYSLLYIALLSAAWVLRNEKHVTMDIVVNRLGPRFKRMLNTFTSVVGAIICGVITWYSAVVTWEYFQLGYVQATVLEPPKWIFLSIIVVGSFLLLIQFLRRAYRYSVRESSKVRLL